MNWYGTARTVKDLIEVLKTVEDQNCFWHAEGDARLVISNDDRDLGYVSNGDDEPKKAASK